MGLNPVERRAELEDAVLAKLREEPNRGRAVICDVEGRTVGYALLISFWSNELGGEVCYIDELFVAPLYRGRGLRHPSWRNLLTGNNRYGQPSQQR